MDQRSNPISQDLRDIAETRAAMADKLEQLEERVQDTVQDAKATVLDVVDHARDAAEALVDRAEDFVEQTKQTLDPTHQIERHPWMMVGGAIVVGYLLGTLEQRQASGQPTQRRLPFGSTRTYSGGPSAHTWERANVWDGVVREVQQEIEHTKGALMEVGRSFIHDFFQQVLPALIAPLQQGRRPQSGYSRRSYDEPKENGPSFSRPT